jgi:MFS transporter, UMF1 family
MLDNKKNINAWCFYDWANSTYNLLITSAIFPMYYSAVAPETINLFGKTFQKDSIASWSISLAFLIVACISPLLSSIADNAGNKKSFMKFFCYLGSLACIALFFFQRQYVGENFIWYGLTCSIIACIGYSGSIVFYNAYLPEIASKNNQDKVSARGFAMGYIGSVILLLVSLVLILKDEKLHFMPTWCPAACFSFVLVGIWWFAWSQIPFNVLQDISPNKNLTTNFITAGYKNLAIVFNKIKNQKGIHCYLISFLFITMGVQTVMYMATYFAAKEIQLESSELIIVVLIIQLVAIIGAFLFAQISFRFGNKTSLMVAIFIWIFVCYSACYLVYTVKEFYVLAFVVGLIMGGTQSMCRSTFSKLIPATATDTASYFSFYDVCEKLGIVIGTGTFGLISNALGMRMSAFALGIYFAIGLIILMFTKLNLPLKHRNNYNDKI